MAVLADCLIRAEDGDAAKVSSEPTALAPWLGRAGAGLCSFPNFLDKMRWKVGRAREYVTCLRANWSTKCSLFDSQI
jgi:hypothetical protein